MGCIPPQLPLACRIIAGTALVLLSTACQLTGNSRIPTTGNPVIPESIGLGDGADTQVIPLSNRVMVIADSLQASNDFQLTFRWLHTVMSGPQGYTATVNASATGNCFTNQSDTRFIAIEGEVFLEGAAEPDWDRIGQRVTREMGEETFALLCQQVYPNQLPEQ